MYGNKKYLSYPFLYEKKNIVEFELLTDEISSLLGICIHECEDQNFKDELTKVCELVYHLNPCVRTKSELDSEEIKWLYERYVYYEEIMKDRESLFVLPTGGKVGSRLHVVRTKAKQLVRLLFTLQEDNIDIKESLFDFSNVLANYCFTAAMYANRIENVSEIPFVSRIYK